MNEGSYDAIIVGSGAAGSCAAKELTERGMSVLLLEAGPFLGKHDFATSADGAPKVKSIDSLSRIRIALEGQHTQARATFISDQTKHLFVNDRKNPYTVPPGQFFLWIRGRQLGGRLHTYGRVLLRMSDYDFKAASRDGHGNDWPICYKDLEPYYERVEKFHGLYGTEENIASLPDGHYVQAPKLTALEQAFKNHVESSWPDRKVISWRFAAPNVRRVPLGVQAALATGRLDLRTDAVVSKITTCPKSGKATGVSFIDRNTHKEHHARGSVVVLCASAIESVRILLNSASAKHPNGIGNSSDQLGRYFMDQTPSMVFGSVPGSSGWETDTSVPQDPFSRPAGGIYIPRFQNLNGATHPDFLRGFAYQGVIGRNYVPDGSPSLFGLMGFGEMLARPENRITLERHRKDAWGIPAPHIDCSLAPNDVRVMQEQLRCSKEMALSCGYKIHFAGNALGLDDPGNAMRDAPFLERILFRRSFKKSLGLGAAIHECGGARMGNDPATSVLNPYNQCWDARNVFVTDASCYVSAGTVGPALSIMAITARACDYIAREFARAGDGL